MSIPISDDPKHNFVMQTKVLEQEAFTSAVTKAKEAVSNSKAPIRVHSTSLSLCRKAYKSFKEGIQQ